MEYEWSNGWARIHRGSNRLTGQRGGCPTNQLDAETNYRWVGDISDEEFNRKFLHGEHMAGFHNKKVLGCPLCN